MCRLCHGIAPRLPYMENRSHWYFNSREASCHGRARVLHLEHEELLSIDQNSWNLEECIEVEQEAEEAVPHRAPPKDRSLSSGWSSPNRTESENVWTSPDFALQLTCICMSVHAGEPVLKKPKAASVEWYDPGNSEPNEHEILFFAFLLCMDAGNVADLQAWAKKVASYSIDVELQGVQWLPPVADWPLHNKTSTLFARMESAFHNVRDAVRLGVIATAMCFWDGEGRHDDLDSSHLSNYFKRKLRALSRNRKKSNEGPKRWRSYSIVYVAELIHRHGVALRKALRLDGMEVDAVPTAHERALAAEARVGELELDLDVLGRELKKAKDAKRKAAERKAAQLEQRRDAAKAKKAADAAKLKQRMEAATAKLETRTKRALEVAEERLEVEYAEDKAKRAKQVADARARARVVESRAKESATRLKRAQAAEARVTELATKIDVMMEAAEEEEPLFSVPTPKVARRDDKGRFDAGPWEQRPLIWAQLARRTPPTAIAANITDVLEVYAKEKVVPMPCLREIQRMRGELTVAGECIAAFRVALAKRVVSFGFDESTKFGFGLMSSNTQIEPHDAPGTTVDVVQRGATLTAGGTADEICKSIDEKIFSHSRLLLMGWRGEHEVKFGKGSWAADGGPSPESIGLHRLSEETLLMSDTCNAARAAKRLLAEASEKASRLAIGDEAWAKMSKEQQERACTCFIGDCHQHLRNIIINAMTIAATEHLKELLEDDLREFSSFDRMSVDGMDLIRAVFKEMHKGGQYAKGKGRECFAWVAKHHASAMWAAFENASGSRQDMAFDGALPIFANRIMMLDFLNGLVNVPKANNTLEKFLWRTLRSNEMTALLRVCTLFKLVVTDPMRWLTGKAKKLEDWSIVSASRMLELAEEAFVAIAADGSKLLDPTFDPFKEIAEQQPLFAAWQKERMARTIKSPDGSTKYRVYERVLAEARSPEGKGNKQASATTVALAEKMSTAALTAMHDSKRAIADKLTSQDGINTPAKQQKMHKATVGAHVANDRVESIFGSYDYVGHIFRGTSVENLSGLAQQMRNHDFERVPNVVKRKQSGDAPPPVAGFYHRLPSDRLRESLVSFARHEAPRARKAAQLDLAEHDNAKLARREERVVILLNKAVEDYAYSKELFAAWQGEQAARDGAAVDRFLKDKPESTQLEYLRKQIEMRVLALGWTQFATRWSSNKDSKVGTVAHLKALLKEILTEEMAARRLKQLPTEAAPPQVATRDLGQLGTADADAIEIEKKAMFSKEELDAQSEAAMQRRVAAGISDTVENLNGKIAPAFDQQLVGKQLEVCWKYFHKDTKEPMLIWATGRVVRVADGLTDKRSKRAQTVLPAGMLLWAWDADPEFGEAAGEQWLALLPQKWNPPRQLLYGWRFDPREFAVPPAERDMRRKAATCEAD